MIGTTIRNGKRPTLSSRSTAGRQEPYTYGSLPGREDFFFVAK